MTSPDGLLSHAPVAASAAPPAPDFCDPQLPHGWLRTPAETVPLGAHAAELLGAPATRPAPDPEAARP